MKIKTAFIALLAMFALALAPAAYADNNTEFGIEDDLTVLGIGGSNVDPDLEVKGFSVFGATQAAPALNIPAAPGNIFVNGYVEVSSGMYVTGGSTFSTGAYFLGISSFSNPANIHVGGGVAGQVLKKVAGGGLVWGNDDAGAGAISGTQNRIVMFGPGGTGGADSKLHQDANNTSLTLLLSSLTVQGTGGEGLGVTGNTKIDGALSVLNANTFTVGTGLTSLGGALNVTGLSTLTGALNVNNAAYFGAAATKSTVAANGSMYLASGSSITLVGANAQITLPNLPSAATDAANKNYVDSVIASSGPWTRDNANNVVKLSTITDNVGIGIALPSAKLHVSSANANAGDLLVKVSSGAAGTQEVFTVKASGELYSKGDSQMGSSVSAIHGVNRAAEANVGLSVDSVGTSGSYAAKFYSNNSLAAWIKKK